MKSEALPKIALRWTVDGKRKHAYMHHILHAPLLTKKTKQPLLKIILLFAAADCIRKYN